MKRLDINPVFESLVTWKLDSSICYDHFKYQNSNQFLFNLKK